MITKALGLFIAGAFTFASISGNVLAASFNYKTQLSDESTEDFLKELESSMYVTESLALTSRFSYTLKNQAEPLESTIKQLVYKTNVDDLFSRPDSVTVTRLRSALGWLEEHVTKAVEAYNERSIGQGSEGLISKDDMNATIKELNHLWRQASQSNSKLLLFKVSDWDSTENGGCERLAIVDRAISEISLAGFCEQW